MRDTSLGRIHTQRQTTFTGSEKGRGHSNGNDAEKLARKAQDAAYLWATDRRYGCSDDGLVELHHHTIRHPHDLDHTQRGGLDRPLGSIPVYPAELGLIISGRLAAPFIMISQNRQADRDRHQAEEDFRTNVEAEQRIEELQRRLADIEVNKLDKIIDLLDKRLPPNLAP